MGSRDITIVFNSGRGIHIVNCLSTDIKPTNVVPGSELYYTDDSSVVYGFFGGVWISIKSNGAGHGVEGSNSGNVTEVFSTQTGNATPVSIVFARGNAQFSAKLVATTAASCDVTLYGTDESDDITNGVLLGTFALSLASSGTNKSYGIVTKPYAYIYGVIENAAGTITSINFNYSV